MKPTKKEIEVEFDKLMKDLDLESLDKFEKQRLLNFFINGFYSGIIWKIDNTIIPTMEKFKYGI